MNYARNAARGTVIVFVISILAVFLGYAMRIVLARNLTSSEYGLFFSVFTFITFFALLGNFGLDQALLKYIPEFQVQDKINQIKNAIVTVLGFKLVFISILAIVLYFCSDFLSVYYFKDPLASTLLLYLVLIKIAAFFREILRTIFNAFQKMFLYSIMHFTENLFILFFLFIFFQFSQGLESPIFAYLTSYVLQFIIFFPFFLKLYPFFKYKFKFSAHLSKTLFKFGTPMLLAGMGSMVILYTDTLILTYFGTLEEVGIYNVVVPTAMLLTFFGRSVRSVIFPMISHLHAKTMTKHISDGARLLQKYSFVIVLPFALVMFSFPKLLLNLLFGTAYSSGAPTLQLLSVGLVFFVVAGINMTILSALGKPKSTTKIMLIGALFNLITNFYFIPKFGMLGAGITSLLSYFLVLVVSTIYLFKLIKIKIPLWQWTKTFFAGFVFVLIIFILRSVLHTNAYLEAFTCLFVAAIVYLVLALLFRIISIKEIQNTLMKR
jgi:stage V sporulation protein B